MIFLWIFLLLLEPTSSLYNDSNNDTSEVTLAQECLETHEPENSNCTTKECINCMLEGYSNFTLLGPNQKLMLIVPYSLLMIIAVIPNLLIIATLLRSATLCTTQNCLVANLACSDILMIIFCMPFTLKMLLEESKWKYGYILCKVG